MRRIEGGKERVLTRGGLTDVEAKSRNGVKLAVRSQLQAIVLAMDCKEGLKPVNRQCQRLLKQQE